MTSQPKVRTSDYYEARGDTVRARLLDALKIDLVGPEAPEEVLSQSPATRYLVGMLAPRGTALSASEKVAGNARAVMAPGVGFRSSISAW